MGILLAGCSAPTENQAPGTSTESTASASTGTTAPAAKVYPEIWPAEPDSGFDYGFAMATSNDLLFVAYPDADNGSAHGVGRVEVFGGSPGAIERGPILESPFDEAESRFGGAMEGWPGWLAVTCLWCTVDGNAAAGAVALYRVDDRPVLTQVLEAPEPAEGAVFGRTMAGDDGLLLIAEGQTDGAGAVHSYVLEAGVWAYTDTARGDDGLRGIFAYSVDVADGHAVVSLPGADDGLGVIRSYSVVDGVFDLRQELQDTGTRSTSLGMEIALVNGLLVAEFVEEGFDDKTGLVVYERIDHTWQLVDWWLSRVGRNAFVPPDGFVPRAEDGFWAAFPYVRDSLSDPEGAIVGFGIRDGKIEDEERIDPPQVRMDHAFGQSLVAWQGGLAVGHLQLARHEPDSGPVIVLSDV